MVSGVTVCKLCGQALKQEEALLGFTHFVPNEAEPLYFFSGSTFHRPCFESHPLSQTVTAAYVALNRTPYINHLSGREMTPEEVDHLISLGYLTSKQEHPLYRYNGLLFDDRTFSQWPALPTLIALLREEKNAGRWRGERADRMLGFLEAALHSDS